jgi:hypothetical protein
MRPTQILLTAIAGLWAVGAAQDYVLRAVTVDGGGSRLTSSGYRAGLSVSQPFASFWLASGSFKGTLGFWPHPYGGSIPGVEEKEDARFQSLPLVFKLAQVSPNPFGRRTVIRYSLARESDVSLRVYNPVGRVVTTLVQAKQSARWYTVSWDVSGVPTAKLPCGTYFCRLEAGEFTATRKIVRTD